MAREFCADVARDSLYHVDVNYRQRMQKLDKDFFEHYQFLWAASKNCMRCVAAWLAHGADVTRGQVNHPEGTVLAWARDSNAVDVLALLEQADVSTPGRPEKIARLDETPMEAQGVWRAGPESLEALRPFFDDDLSAQVWHAALRGDGRAVYALIHLRHSPPCFEVNTDDLPPRMFYWGLLEFVRFAKLVWQDDVVRASALQQVCKILEEVENTDRDFVQKYYANFPEDSDHLLWLSWSKGLLQLEATSHDRETRLDNFWAAFSLGVPVASRASFTGPEDWWTFDPFMSARNCRFECPKYCKTWKLRDWTHFQAGATAAVKELEDGLLLDAAAGWQCWTVEHEIFISTLLCEDVEICRKWLRCTGDRLSMSSEDD